METRGFFSNRSGKRLYFCAHCSGEGEIGWIFCNPILEEKIFTHSIYVSLARRLAAAGHSVLRFDYTGDGDSDDSEIGVDTDTWVDDISDAAKFAASHFRITRPNLFGVRFGGSLACAAATAADARRVLAWEPVVNGANYVQELLMLNLTGQLAAFGRVMEDRRALRARIATGQTVNVWGHELMRRTVESLERFDLTSALEKVECPVEILGITKTEGGAMNKELRMISSSDRVSVHPQVGTPFWWEPKYNDSAQDGLCNASKTLTELAA